MSNSPLLTNGMVLWVGEDPRGGYYYLSYNIFKEGRAICFEESVPYLSKIGLKTTPHWKPWLAEKGYFGVYGVDFHPMTQIDYARGTYSISPVVQKLYNEGMNNKTFLNLLRKED